MVKVTLIWLVPYLSKSSVSLRPAGSIIQVKLVRIKLKPFHAAQKGSYGVALYSRRNLKENLHNTQGL